MTRMHPQSLWAKLIALSVSEQAAPPAQPRTAPNPASSHQATSNTIEPGMQRPPLLEAPAPNSKRKDKMLLITDLLFKYLPQAKNEIVCQFLTVPPSTKVALLGQGSYGHVFEICAPSAVAVKLTKSAPTEADMSQTLKHPHIIHFLDSMWIAGVTVLKMERASLDLRAYRQSQPDISVYALTEHMVEALLYLSLDCIFYSLF